MGPGEYYQNLERTTFADSTVVAGYTTLRLRASQPFVESSGFEGNAVQVTIDNTSSTTAQVRFKQTDNVVSGPRLDASPLITIVGLGTQTLDISPIKNYLELAGISGAGELKLQLVSKIKFDQMAFDRSDPVYPQSLWSATNTDGSYVGSGPFAGPSWP